MMAYQCDNAQVIIQMKTAFLYLSCPYPGYHRKRSQYDKNKLNGNEPCDIETAICRKQSHIDAAERDDVKKLWE